MFGRPDDRTSLDRRAALPLYAQLRDALRREARGLRPGDRFPSEAVLRARYRVSRATVRQALAELEADGLVRRVQGVGSFVGAPKIRHVPLLTSFSDLAAAQGFTPSHRVLESTVAEVRANDAEEIGFAAGTRCRFLRRLLLADGGAVGLAETWLPLASLNGRDELLAGDRLNGGSMYDVLESDAVGLVLDHAVETISPGIVDEAAARLLECAPGTPVLLIRRLTYAADGRGVESTRLMFVGERYEYRVELMRPA